MGANNYSLTGTPITHRWQEMFTVQWWEDGDNGSGWGLWYTEDLVDQDGQVKKPIAIYRDPRYAQKQAKYKYKKLMNKIDKMFLG